MLNLLLAKVETNVHLRWESALLSTRLFNEVDQWGCLRLKYDYSYFFPAILFIVYLFLSDRLLNSFFIYFIKGYSVDCLMEKHR